MKEQEEKQKLLHLLKWQQDLAAYIAGQGPFVLPFTQEGSKMFTKLGKKYKHHPEFQQFAHMMPSDKSHHTRSKKRPLSWWQK